jgi:hypothetical protein
MFLYIMFFTKEYYHDQLSVPTFTFSLKIVFCIDVRDITYYIYVYFFVRTK